MYVNRQIYMQRNSKHVPRERGAGEGVAFPPVPRRALPGKVLEGGAAAASPLARRRSRRSRSLSQDSSKNGFRLRFATPRWRGRRAFISRRRVFYSLCPKPTRGLPGARRNPSGNGLPKRTSSLPVSHAEGVAGISSARRETPSAPHLLPDVVLLRALPRPPVKSAPVKPEGRHISWREAASGDPFTGSVTVARILVYTKKRINQSVI